MSEEDELRTRALECIGGLAGPYRLDALLGVGGMAAVYAATHEGSGERFAVKMLHRELCAFEPVRKRFEQEGLVASSIAHPGVVRMVESGVASDDAPFLAMELLEGSTLEQYRCAIGGRLTAREALGVASVLLDVLGAAHEAGIVHRDLKPENVFVTRDGVLKLMDFGVARLLDGSNTTRTGALMGTPAYMSPEQAAGNNRDIDARSDIWSLGAMLFVLLTGEEVHPAPTEPMQLIYAGTQPARSITAADPTMPRALAQVVDVALAWEREQRFQTAGEMQRALLAAAEGMALDVPARLGEARVSGFGDEAPTMHDEEPAPATLILGSRRASRADD